MNLGRLAGLQLDAEALVMTGQLRETQRLTTLAMRAAHDGIKALSDDERRELYKFVGFDLAALKALRPEDFWSPGQ